jgi:hypothetical protein
LSRPESGEYGGNLENFIHNIHPHLNETRFDALVRSPLRMFTDETECVKCINDNVRANKRVFLITSGQTGAQIIPQIHDKLSGYIYVFCAQRNLHERWTGPYEKDIEIYDDERGVFAKVLLDIGVYYLTKGQAATENPAAATQYFYWARRLIESATKIDGIKREDYLNYIKEELSDLNAAPSDE